jgi:hypothetical protein
MTVLNRARMTTATSGTGTVTLGSAVSKFATFAEAGAANATQYAYCIEDGNDFEIGIGTYTTSGTTFSRDTVTLSKIAGVAGTTKLTLSGTAEIFITARASDLGLRSLKLDQFAATTSAELRTVLSDETGSGAAVFATSPTLVTPVLGTVAAGSILTNATGLPVSTGIAGLGTGVGTFLATPTIANLNTAVSDADLATQGKQTIFMPAGAMTARTTNGAASGTTELATNDVMLVTKDYDTTTEEGCGFWVGMPKSWNESTVTFQAMWTAASGSGGVAWGLAAYSFSDDDAMDTAVSGQQVVTDTLITANDMHITSESSAITIGGTPAEGDAVYFELTREVANGSDTLAVDAKLIGIRLYFTTNAGNDA